MRVFLVVRDSVFALWKGQSHPNYLPPDMWKKLEGWHNNAAQIRVDANQCIIRAPDGDIDGWVMLTTESDAIGKGRSVVWLEDVEDSTADSLKDWIAASKAEGRKLFSAGAAEAFW